MIGVVGTNHKADDFGLKAIEFTILNSPQDILCPISAIAQIQGFTISKEVAVARATFPIMSYGIADEHEIHFS